jgi:hypothetical protein
VEESGRDADEHSGWHRRAGVVAGEPRLIGGCFFVWFSPIRVLTLDHLFHVFFLLFYQYQGSGGHRVVVNGHLGALTVHCIYLVRNHLSVAAGRKLWAHI